MADTTTGDFFPIRFILECVTKTPRVVRADGGVACEDAVVPRALRSVVQRVVCNENVLTIYPHKRHVFQEFCALKGKTLPLCAAAQDAFYVANVLCAAARTTAKKTIDAEADDACNWCVSEVLLRIYRSERTPELLNAVPRISLTWWLLHQNRMSQVGALVETFAEVNAQLSGYACYNKTVGWGPYRERLAIRRR